MSPSIRPPRAADPSRCPLCGQTNLCAMEIARATGVAQAPCWCTQMQFTPELLVRVPQAAQQLVCICQRCATPDDGAPDARAPGANA